MFGVFRGEKGEGRKSSLFPLVLIVWVADSLTQDWAVSRSAF